MALIDLKKKVGIVLEKRKVSSNIMAQVGVAFDITGSMKGLYNTGVVQALAERLLAVALRFDDNGNLDAWSFCEGSNELPGVTEKNYTNYVSESLVNNRSIEKWGGTNFSPVLNQINGFYFGSTEKRTKAVEVETKGMFGFFKKKEVSYVSEVVTVDGQNDGKLPVYLMFVTDGDNFDATAANLVIESMKDKNIYLEFVGIGTDAKFDFCKRAADKYANVGFVHFKDIVKTSDETLYEELLNEEFCAWLKK
jgi:hypothetical protein